jgi:phosphoribosyl 1,2-cyclic phosphate phosphodiesterase
MATGKVILLGTGTSQGVPIIGCGCEVCHSADPRDKRLRTSAYIQTADTSVLVDAGPDFRQQALRAVIKNIDAVIVTHEHKDHTGGIDDLRPYNYLYNREIRIYGWPRVLHRIEQDYAYAFSDIKYPGIPVLNLVPIQESNLIVGSLRFDIFTVMHHKLPVLAFRCGDFAYITDANAIPEEHFAHLEGLNTLVLDALQPEPHLSHFTLDQAVEVAHRIGAAKTYFTHISHRMGLTLERNAKLPKGMELGYDGLTIGFSY